MEEECETEKLSHVTAYMTASNTVYPRKREPSPVNE